MVGLDVGDHPNGGLADSEVGSAPAEVGISQKDRVVLVSGIHVIVASSNPIKGEVCDSPLCLIWIVWIFQLCLFRPK